MKLYLFMRSIISVIFITMTWKTRQYCACPKSYLVFCTKSKLFLEYGQENINALQILGKQGPYIKLCLAQQLSADS